MHWDRDLPVDHQVGPGDLEVADPRNEVQPLERKVLTLVAVYDWEVVVRVVLGAPWEPGGIPDLLLSEVLLFQYVEWERLERSGLLSPEYFDVVAARTVPPLNGRPRAHDH